MSASFTNQVLAQIELWQRSGEYEQRVYTLPRHLDEKVAALHLEKVGAQLTKLREDQAGAFSAGLGVEICARRANGAHRHSVRRS